MDQWISTKDRLPPPGAMALRYHRSRQRGESVYAHYSYGPVVDEEEPERVLCDYWMPVRPPETNILIKRAK